MPGTNQLKLNGSATASGRGECSPTGNLFVSFLSLAGVLVVTGLLTFRDFVFGNKVLLYKERGSDSLNEYLPVFSHLSDYLHAHGLPSWSFSMGMGQDLFSLVGYLILDPVVWLPKTAIPAALVFHHIAKILIAGLLFAAFLRLRDCRFPASWAGGLSVSFSAFMCAGSCWIVFADEVVCFTFVLFAVEMAISRGRWVFLAFAVALSGAITFFDLYLSAVLLSCYVPFRLIETAGWRPARSWRYVLQLAGVALLGVGIGAVVCFDNAYAMFQSPRGSGEVATGWPIPSLFQGESIYHYLTALFRAFSNDILGRGDSFRGWRNYLEAPPNYCGLLSLILLPQVFVGEIRPKRLLFAGVIGMILLPILWPWFRHLFWLFQGGYYRTLSLFSVIAVITLSMMVFSRYCGGSRISLGILAATLTGLLGILHFPWTSVGAPYLDPSIKVAETIFLAGYGVLLAAGQVMKRQGVAAVALLLLLILEFTYLDRITVATEDAVTKTELKERIGYNDETIEIVRDINSVENDFFRIRKVWPSSLSIDPSYNDAMMFGFYGTSSYSSFNPLHYVNFLLSVGAVSEDNALFETIWTKGLISLPLISTFACEKYVLTKDPDSFKNAEFYKFVGSRDGISVFRNALFLPLGLTYPGWISKNAFFKLSNDSAKPLALFHSVVLADPIVDFPEIDIEQLKRRMIETPLPAIVAERRRTALDIRFFSQTRIEGFVRPDSKSILVIQTPFDPGWHATIDGNSTPTLVVDSGLLGLVVDGGSHAVKLSYCPPFLLSGLITTLISLLVLSFGRWKCPRLRLPSLSE